MGRGALAGGDRELFATEIAPDQVAAFIASRLGEGGFVPAPFEFLQGLRRSPTATGFSSSPMRSKPASGANGNDVRDRTSRRRAGLDDAGEKFGAGRHAAFGSRRSRRGDGCRRTGRPGRNVRRQSRRVRGCACDPRRLCRRNDPGFGAPPGPTLANGSRRSRSAFPRSSTYADSARCRRSSSSTGPTLRDVVWRAKSPRPRSNAAR